MFLHLLNDAQKAAFFDLASEMLEADGEAADAEISYMDRLVAEAGLVKKQALNDTVETMDLSVFDTPASRHTVILELLILAVVDGRFHVKEAAFANDLIDALGIDEGIHEALCRLTKEAVGLMNGLAELDG